MKKGRKTKREVEGGEMEGESTNIVVDEVQVVSRSDGHSTASSLGQTGVGSVQRLVHIHECINDGLTMGGRLGQIGVHHWDHVRWDVLREGGGNTKGKDTQLHGFC